MGGNVRSCPDLRTLRCRAQVPRRWTGLPKAGAWCHELIRHEAQAISTRPQSVPLWRPRCCRVSSVTQQTTPSVSEGPVCQQISLH